MKRLRDELMGYSSPVFEVRAVMGAELLSPLTLELMAAATDTAGAGGTAAGFALG